MQVFLLSMLIPVMTACSGPAGDESCTIHCANPQDSGGDPGGSPGIAPSIPTNLEGSAITPYQIQLSWNSSSDDGGVSGYQIYQATVLVGTTTDTRYLHSGLYPDSTYHYTVVAFDQDENLSSHSDPVQVDTPADDLPTELSLLAASLKPGEWAPLTTLDFNDGDIFATADNGSILEYNNEASWDPINRRIFIIGTARGTGSNNYGIEHQKWVQYSETGNQWTTLPRPPNYIGWHAYDHAALDTTTGSYYVRKVESNAVYKYSKVIENQTENWTWSRLADIPISYNSCCNSLEYFPDMDAVIFIRGNDSGATEIFRYHGSENIWTQLAADEHMPMGDYHDFSAYDPVHGILYFGAGKVYGEDKHRELYKLDKLGNVTRLADAFIGYDLASAITVVDPSTGNLLVIDETENATIHEYVYSGDYWRRRDIESTFRTTDSTADNNLSTVATAVAEYGVIVFFKHDGANSGVWVYKHKPL